jgi:hypothetical protein
VVFLSLNHEKSWRKYFAKAKDRKPLEVFIDILMLKIMVSSYGCTIVSNPLPLLIWKSDK